MGIIDSCKSCARQLLGESEINIQQIKNNPESQGNLENGHDENKDNKSIGDKTNFSHDIILSDKIPNNAIINKNKNQNDLNEEPINKNEKDDNKIDSKENSVTSNNNYAIEEDNNNEEEKDYKMLSDEDQ